MTSFLGAMIQWKKERRQDSPLRERGLAGGVGGEGMGAGEGRAEATNS
jgi:hypothetical protein